MICLYSKHTLVPRLFLLNNLQNLRGKNLLLQSPPFWTIVDKNRHRQIIEKICVAMEMTVLKVNGILPLDVCTEMISFEFEHIWN